MSIPMIDDYKFQQADDSPVDNDWRQGGPRCPECKGPVNEDEECLDLDCLVERLKSICPGYDDEECGDEIPADARYCKTHQREFDRDEEVANRAGDEDFARLVSYPHLMD